ncbi:MAG: hypothetical protein Q8862_00810 [Bacteroidota bacterium]|nr:hypothetical protein [Bacteroidota bacterium]MDP4205072.1 hypothetical protein [Bacteroidota bacterium]
MKVSEIATLLDAKIICGEKHKDENIEKAFSSDLMSDVLRIDATNLLLMTGLSNLQTIRTAEMADIGYILFVRSKKVTPEMIKLACENEIVIMESPYSLFKASGVLYNAGINALY